MNTFRSKDRSTLPSQQKFNHLNVNRDTKAFASPLLPMKVNVLGWQLSDCGFSHSVVLT